MKSSQVTISRERAEKFIKENIDTLVSGMNIDTNLEFDSLEHLGGDKTLQLYARVSFDIKVPLWVIVEEDS